MLKPPSYAPTAKADILGWRNRHTGELLEVRRHTVEQVEEYESALAKSNELPVPDLEPDVESLDGKTKGELVEIAEAEGAVYASGATKAEIIEAIELARELDEE